MHLQSLPAAPLLHGSGLLDVAPETSQIKLCGAVR